jgi:hypothetical protein
MIADRPFILALARQPSDFGDVCRALKHNIELLRMYCLYNIIGEREIAPYEMRAVREANRILGRASKPVRILAVDPVNSRQHHIKVTWKGPTGIVSEVLNLYPPSFRRKDVENDPEIPVPDAP